MRLSKYFLPVLKEAPSEAAITSHKLMLRAGMIRQSASGIYSWLPLGLRILRRIETIVREEMDRAGAVELLMPTLQPAELWRESGRYDDYGAEMLRISDRHERDLLYGPTNEELITEIFRAYVKSYKQLPLNLYHQQWKFRDEIRPRFGVMRGREFYMKDAYSFDLDADAARRSYQRMFIAYLRAFSRMGLDVVPMAADPGPIGGDLSHEFVLMADNGESEVFFDAYLHGVPVPGEDFDFFDDRALAEAFDRRASLYAATEEKHDPERFAALPPERQITARGIEVGHIFYFGTKYSDAMNAMVQDGEGQQRAVHGGSYGIGVSRLVGAIIEASHDERGIVWPAEVAPFGVGIVNMRPGDAGCDEAAGKAYEQAAEAGLDPLLDDTSERAGAKFARMELIGLPWQIVVGPRGVKAGVVELRRRGRDGSEELALGEGLARIGAEAGG